MHHLHCLPPLLLPGAHLCELGHSRYLDAARCEVGTHGLTHASCAASKHLYRRVLASRAKGEVLEESCGRRPLHPAILYLALSLQL